MTTTTVWIECQLRHYDTNELLVVMGWQLVAVPTLLPTHCDTENDDSKKYQNNHYVTEYQIDRVDWQDFREMFRPGIGWPRRMDTDLWLATRHNIFIQKY